MEHKEIIEIIKEARKAGMQTALMMFGALLIIGGLFGFYIYKSFETNSYNVEAVQTNENGDNNIKQGIE